MAKLQPDEELSDRQVEEITGFLKARSDKSAGPPEKSPGQ